MKTIAFISMALWLMLGTFANAQSTVAKTYPATGTIVAGGTFQLMPGTLGTTVASSTARRSLTVQNNNTSTDNCWLFIGAGSATTGASVLLAPGQGYTRYFPYVPSDPLQITCATTGDTFYADHQ